MVLVVTGPFNYVYFVECSTLFRRWLPDAIANVSQGLMLNDLCIRFGSEIRIGSLRRRYTRLLYRSIRVPVGISYTRTSLVVHQRRISRRDAIAEYETPSSVRPASTVRSSVPHQHRAHPRYVVVYVYSVAGV